MFFQAFSVIRIFSVSSLIRCRLTVCLLCTFACHQFLDVLQNASVQALGESGSVSSKEYLSHTILPCLQNTQSNQRTKTPSVSCEKLCLLQACFFENPEKFQKSSKIVKTRKFENSYVLNHILQKKMLRAPHFFLHVLEKLTTDGIDSYPKQMNNLVVSTWNAWAYSNL